MSLIKNLKVSKKLALIVAPFIIVLVTLLVFFIHLSSTIVEQSRTSPV